MFILTPKIIYLFT
uniref:Uncharacterized protein n=1 Tax=Rhizophora mucronata TaxID=61149 RepID=A0A2P2NWM7_RHIMU